MPAFISLVGKRVEASYRAGDIPMTATGFLAADSGQSIRIEDHFSQSGRNKTLLLEIPYSSLIRIREVLVQPEPAPKS
jgi:hypothetical protein